MNNQLPVNGEPPVNAKPVRPWFKKKRIMIPLSLLALIVIFGAMGGNNKDATSGDSGKNPVPAVSIPAKGEPAKSEPAPSAADKVPAEYRSALKKAGDYARIMNMCKAAIYDQLVSSAGEKFDKKAAQYAIDNLEADWNAIALAQAKTYRDTMSMSPAAIRDQLISPYGGKCTKDQADYAIKHLDD